MSTSGGNREHCDSCGCPLPGWTWDGLPVIIRDRDTHGRVQVAGTGETVWTVTGLLRREGGKA